MNIFPVHHDGALRKTNPVKELIVNCSRHYPRQITTHEAYARCMDDIDPTGID